MKKFTVEEVLDWGPCGRYKQNDGAFVKKLFAAGDAQYAAGDAQYAAGDARERQLCFICEILIMDEDEGND